LLQISESNHSSSFRKISTKIPQLAAETASRLLPPKPASLTKSRVVETAGLFFHGAFQRFSDFQKKIGGFTWCRSAGVCVHRSKCLGIRKSDPVVEVGSFAKKNNQSVPTCFNLEVLQICFEKGSSCFTKSGDWQVDMITATWQSHQAMKL